MSEAQQLSMLVVLIVVCIGEHDSMIESRSNFRQDFVDKHQ